MMFRMAGVLVAAALVGAAFPAEAGMITFEGADAQGRSARVTFQNSGTDLIVKLKNTSMADVMAPSDVLTAVFFNVDGNPALTRVSATVKSGSSVLFGGTDPGNVVGGEFSYTNGLNQYGANSGISSTGLNYFGPNNRFPGNNLFGEASPNGLDYGLTSAGDNPGTGNSKVTGEVPLIKNQVVFTLGGWLLGDPTPANLSNVTFQYGTSWGQPNFGSRIVVFQTPEPGLLLLFGIAGIAAHRHFRRRPAVVSPDSEL